MKHFTVTDTNSFIPTQIQNCIASIQLDTKTRFYTDVRKKCNYSGAFKYSAFAWWKI